MCMSLHCAAPPMTPVRLHAPTCISPTSQRHPPPRHTPVHTATPTPSRAPAPIPQPIPPPLRLWRDTHSHAHARPPPLPNPPCPAPPWLARSTPPPPHAGSGLEGWRLGHAHLHGVQGGRQGGRAGWGGAGEAQSTRRQLRVGQAASRAVARSGQFCGCCHVVGLGCWPWDPAAAGAAWLAGSAVGHAGWR